MDWVMSFDNTGQQCKATLIEIFAKKLIHLATQVSYDSLPALIMFPEGEIFTMW